MDKAKFAVTIVIALIAVGLGAIILAIPGPGFGVTSAYPVFSTPTAVPHQPGSHQIYLPIVLGGDNQRTNYYAQAEKRNGYWFGVEGIILTADPIIVEPTFSYASINIATPDGEWLEVGWFKSSQSTNCEVRFVWAKQPGTPIIIDNPTPTPGETYKYRIKHISSDTWNIRILDMDNNILFNMNIENDGMFYGDIVQAVGEVRSPQKQNEMGSSSLKSLRWMDGSETWHAWDGWVPGRVDYPPYNVFGIASDPDNGVIVYGNNYVTAPPGSLCP